MSNKIRFITAASALALAVGANAQTFTLNFTSQDDYHAQVKAGGVVHVHTHSTSIPIGLDDSSNDTGYGDGDDPVITALQYHYRVLPGIVSVPGPSGMEEGYVVRGSGIIDFTGSSDKWPAVNDNDPSELAGTLNPTDDGSIRFSFTAIEQVSGGDFEGEVLKFDDGTGLLANMAGTGTISNTTNGDPVTGMGHGTGNTSIYANLAAVPEPSSFIPMGLGALGLIVRRKKNNAEVR